MVRREHLLLVIAGCLLAFALQADAGNSEYEESPDPDKDPGSYVLSHLRLMDLMVEGTVIAVNDSVSAAKHFDPAARTPGRLYTFVTLQVDSVLKGDYSAPTLTFWNSGGHRWGYSDFSTFSTRFEVGSKVVVFLFSYKLTTPLAEGFVSPPYHSRGVSDHYVVLGDSVYRAEDLRRAAHRRKESGITEFRAEPVFSVGSMFELVREYLKSTSIESLAVKADVIAIGEVLDRRVEVNERGMSSEVIQFGNGSMVKGEASHMPLEIRGAGNVTDPLQARVDDRVVFPDNERILVFLRREPDGTYRPLGYKAAQVLSNKAQEEAATQRISAALGH